MMMQAAALPKLSPEAARAVLEERARLLARAETAPLRADDVIEVVVFALGTERYALPTSCLLEVLPLLDVTPVPGTPAHLLGVVNLRGEILAVFDLRKFFGMAVQSRPEHGRVLVLGDARPEFGVAADAVIEVMRLRTGDIAAPPGSLAGVAREYMRGLTHEALIVLDGAVLLQDRRLVVDLNDEAVLRPTETSP